jgi:hypothetical protein
MVTRNSYIYIFEPVPDKFSKIDGLMEILDKFLTFRGLMGSPDKFPDSGLRPDFFRTNFENFCQTKMGDFRKIPSGLHLQYYQPSCPVKSPSM